MDGLKLFIWEEDILTDYSDGLVVVVAESEDEARQMACKEIGRDADDGCGLDKRPDRVVDLSGPDAKTIAWVYGGS